jgi:hypothetical protein
LFRRDNCFAHRDRTWVPDRRFQGLLAAFFAGALTAETAGYNHYRSAAKMKLSAPPG